MNWTQNIILVFSLAISAFSLVIVYTYRKKDFQITILKEQIEAYKKLVENLFQTTQRINKMYSESFDADKYLSNPDYLDKFEEAQGLIFINFGPEYTASYNQFQKLIFLLPEDVIDATQGYYLFISDLFENQNDSDLGIKLLTDLNQKVFEVINAIRNHIAIDTLTDETRKLLSKGSQLKFIDEDEMEDLNEMQN